MPIGKTNMDEFAMGSSCENSALGVTRNPYDLSRVPGGSSGGSAAAVAAYEATIGIGSDTGGSIREPAAFCNLVGFKPTYGRVSRYGLIAFASSLDQIGPFARTVEDAALAYDAMGGYDPMDSTSIDRPFETTADASARRSRGVRVGIVKRVRDRRARPGDRRRLCAGVSRPRKRSAPNSVEVELPTADYGLATYYLIAPAECSSNLARFDGVRYGLRVDGADVQRDVRAHARGGLRPGSQAAHPDRNVRALERLLRRLLRARAEGAHAHRATIFERAFAKSCDLIACPAASSPAFQFNAKSDPYSMYLMDYYTIPMSLAGLPALSVPCGWVTPPGGDRPMPMGLQLCAPLFAERPLLAAAHAYEQKTQHARKYKPTLTEVVG